MVIKTLRQLATPEQADCIFVSPDYRNWNLLLGENKSLLSIFHKTNTTSGSLLNIAIKYTQQIGLPALYGKEYKSIIVTGHQPIWHHGGILAKNIIASRFAKETDGAAVHLVLDHDICDSSIVIPESDHAGSLHFKTIQLEQIEQNIPLELRPVPSREQVNNFINAVSDGNDSYCSDIWKQCSEEILKYIDSFRNTADLVTSLQAMLNQALGLEMIYLPISIVSENKCFINFISSIVCDAFRFADIYNQAILNQRQAFDLKPNQTLKSLKVDFQDKVVQLPFWLIYPNGKRLSLYVRFNNKNISFGSGFDVLGTFDKNDAQQFVGLIETHNCRIRPKAVGLTLFARLYFADWFIHGIGGGKYEYLTDYIIRKYYGISNLSFGIATATTPWLLDKLKSSEQVSSYREFFFGLFHEQRLRDLANLKGVQDE